MTDREKLEDATRLVEDLREELLKARNLANAATELMMSWKERYFLERQIRDNEVRLNEAEKWYFKEMRKDEERGDGKGAADSAAETGD